MTDEPFSDPSPGPLDPGETSRTEDELDAVLEQAVALAAAVTQEIGSPDSRASAADSAPKADDAEDSPADVDTRLEELDGLVSETNTQVGSDAASVAEEAAGSARPDELDGTSNAERSSADQVASTGAESVPIPDDAALAAPPGDDAIPDFMKELTCPEAGADATPDSASPPDGSAAAGAAPSASAELPGGAAEAPLSEPEPFADDSDADKDEVLRELDAVEPTAKSASTEAPERAGIFAKLFGIVRTPAVAACECMIRVLEIMDAPTKSLGVWPRRAIGWIAVATAGTAAIVHLISLF